ncbi:LuxR C-terminal-related transcriptional regulator [Streptomyces sp. NPDC059002]|uniref:LuxR C-terminal-related transcriptional regulator n=1 Tax=Streptomyces sp. NPDC059002 TaxID=3346690 RepID=UPI0036BED7AB
MADGHIPHDVEELCAAGTAVYARALREGHVLSSDAEQAPCLINFGLLHPDLHDVQQLRPTAPAVALPRLLRTIEDRISHHRLREERLAASFESFLALDSKSLPREPSVITVLEGLPRIHSAIDQAVAKTTQEVLIIQPGGARSPEQMAESLPRAQEILSRGGRMRTLYQHTTRHSMPVLGHYGLLQGDVEARTLDELTERLFIFDRTTAFVPVSDDLDHLVALELRYAPLVEYFATTFWRLWNLATPMFPDIAPQPVKNGITTRQHAIATLLTEGLTDTEIASRLGMNVRTARVHIAKLAATLGSHSRAQLGYLIGQSGILDHKP